MHRKQGEADAELADEAARVKVVVGLRVVADGHAEDGKAQAEAEREVASTEIEGADLARISHVRRRRVGARGARYRGLTRGHRRRLHDGRHCGYRLDLRMQRLRAPGT